jgi:hypothetical protein
MPPRTKKPVAIVEPVVPVTDVAIVEHVTVEPVTDVTVAVPAVKKKRSRASIPKKHKIATETEATETMDTTEAIATEAIAMEAIATKL